MPIYVPMWLMQRFRRRFREFFKANRVFIFLNCTSVVRFSEKSALTSDLLLWSLILSWRYYWDACRMERLAMTNHFHGTIYKMHSTIRNSCAYITFRQQRQITSLTRTNFVKNFMIILGQQFTCFMGAQLTKRSSRIRESTIKENRTR